MPIKPVTVTQLSTYLKQIFDAEELLHNISVVGEISGYSNIRGTAYFTLKDENCSLQCVCFVADNYLNIKNGDSVIVVGSPKYYTKGGKLNFNVVNIQHYGESVLYQKFLQLKDKLEQKGYFSAEHKVSIPKNIRRIGVVSSEGGAVIQDIINVSSRRNPSIDIVLYPVKVQGENAEFEIAKGIQILDEYNVDAIIVARGGGSVEDLQPFNTEVVANATFNCKKFIMSAVGHETDFTIIDFCSDMRAPTPSAAAELLCENLQEKKQKVKMLILSLTNVFFRFLQEESERFFHIARTLQKEYLYIEQDYKNAFNDNMIKLNKLIKDFYLVKEKELLFKKGILNKLNPQEVLKLGYASVKANGKYVISKNQVCVGDIIELKFKDGAIIAKTMGVK